MMCGACRMRWRVLHLGYLRGWHTYCCMPVSKVNHEPAIDVQLLGASDEHACHDCHAGWRRGHCSLGPASHGGRNIDVIRCCLQGSQSAGCTLSPSVPTAMMCARSAWRACLIRTPSSSAAATTRSSWCTLCPATRRSDLHPAIYCAVQEQGILCLHLRSEQLQAFVGILYLGHRGSVSQTCVLMEWGLCCLHCSTLTVVSMNATGASSAGVKVPAGRHRALRCAR